MKFVDDMKIGKKLLGGFLVVLIILIVVSVISYVNLGAMATNSASIYSDRLLPTAYLKGTQSDLYQIRGDIYKSILIPNEQETNLVDAEKSIADLDNKMNAYRATNLLPEEKTGLATFDQAWAVYKSDITGIIASIRKGDGKTIIPQLATGTQLSNERKAIDAVMLQLTTINENEGKSLNDKNSALAASASLETILATIIAVIVGIVLALYLSRSITGPVDEVKRNLNELSRGHLGNRMKLNRKDEIGEMAGTMDQFSEFLQNDVVGSLKKVAQCDLNIHLVPKDAQDEITPIMIQTVKSLDDMMIEVNILVEAATQGHLDQRGDPEKFEGCYKDILTGMNNTLDAVVGPLNVAAEYVDRISKGDVPPKITDTYKGDFNEIKNNLNQCIDAVNLLVNDSNTLSDAAYEGKLATRADAARHQGDFKKVIEGVNGTLDTLIGYIDSMPNPIVIIDTEFTIRYMNKAGAKLAETTNGDLISQRAHCFDFFKTSDCRTPKCACANSMRTGHESASATDAHPGKHNLDISYSAFPVKNKQGQVVGAFEIVTDLTAIKTAERSATRIADYQNNEAKKITGALGQFAKGDLSFQISADAPDADTKGVAQQFDTIYGSLNQSVSAVRNLVTDANMLSEGAVAGKLTTRADASKHQGDYRKIIEGVNSTLDAVIDPLNVAADYVDKISKGEIPQKITADYKGDFNLIKNNLNQCIDGLGGLVEGNAVLQRMAVNDYTTKVEGKYRGIYAEVGTAVNTVEDRIRNVTETVNQIAVGDISRLEEYHKMGKRSENDQLMPAFIEMMEAIERMIQDSKMLADAAVAGNLTTRADASKHQGDYGKVIEGVNQTLDAVIEPVNEAMRIANEYSRANFTARFDEKLTARGDFIRFREALDNIGIQVSQALTSVNHHISELAAGSQEASASVEEVAAGSNQIAKSASAVSINADKSSEGIRQVLSAMEDLSVTVQGVATKAETVAQLAKKSEELSKHGTDLANKADKGMGGITETSSEVNRIILDVKSQMDKIGDIVGVIANLANQTNLLALNAAIEAARAGDAGRGFAVVATEVKSLAEESHSSAENIRQMIGDLQKQTQRAAETVEKANSEVKEGSDALSQTLDVFNKIVTSIDDINKNITEVAAATEEQAASVEEVTASVNAVNALVNDTTKEATDSAAASEESSAAIEQISKVVQRVTTIVDEVNNEVSKFRITGGDIMPEPADTVSVRSMARNVPPNTAHVA